MIAVLEWSLHHWFLFFILSALGVFEGIRDFFLGLFAAIASIGERRHERRMEEITARNRFPGFPLPPAAVSPKPGPCVHRNVAAIVPAGEDKPVGWLCRACDTQLPADWAVRQEDL